uniref:Uncharacterized protein n=1 Tax=Lygus hesperus TaxID=30085 RepID=A0A146L0V2_LYGHE
MYLHNPDVGLDPNFLPELGENPHVPPPPAPALNDSIAIQHGLPQEAFLAIWDSYQIPSHLPLLNPPLLNPEIMALVGNSQNTCCCSGNVPWPLQLGLSKVINLGGDGQQ